MSSVVFGYSHVSPITSVILSTFDYISGPSLITSVTCKYEDCSDALQMLESTSSATASNAEISFEEIDNCFDDTITAEMEHSPPTTSLTNDSSMFHLANVTMDDSVADSGITSQSSAVDENTNMATSMNLSIHDEISKLLTDSNVSDEEMPSGISPQPRPCSSTMDFSPVFASVFSDSQRYDLVNSLTGDYFAALEQENEQYVVRHVLAEQIHFNYLPCDPIIHKFASIPVRNLAYGSYIFWLHPGTKNEQLLAFSVVFDDKKANWYWDYKEVIEQFAKRLISSISDELLNSNEATTKFLEEETRRLVIMLSETRSITDNWHHSAKLISTYESPSCNSNFLLQAIAGVLMSQGHAYIYGASDFDECTRLVKILTLFVPHSKRKFCASLYASQILPDLCLQIVPEKELKAMETAARQSTWPVSVINMKTRRVGFSGPYWEHEKRRNDPHYKTLPLVNVHGLPPKYANYVTKSTLETLHLFVQNHARVYINLIENLSLPDKNDKSKPYSKGFKLADVFKTMKISSFEEMCIVMAQAELDLPTITQFVCQNATLI